MYCSKCGQQIENDAAFCKYCGTAIVRTNSNDTKSGFWDFISFFLPLLGFMLFIFYKDDKPVMAKAIREWSVTGISVGLGLSFLYFIATFFNSIY